MTPLDLKKWRERNGIKQTELAELLGVHEITICRWETGYSPMPKFLDFALAEAERRLFKTKGKNPKGRR